MVNVVDPGVSCECGASRFVHSGSCVAEGGLIICATCGRTSRVSLVLRLAPVTWEKCALELSDSDFLAFGWARRSAQELRQRAGRFRASDRAGTALGASLVVLLVLVVARAVFS